MPRYDFRSPRLYFELRWLRASASCLTAARPTTSETYCDEKFGKATPRLRVPLAPVAAAAFLLETTLRPLGIQPPLHRRRIDFFRKSFRLDGSKAQRLLGFVPKTGFSEGATQTARWYEQAGELSRIAAANQAARCSAAKVRRPWSRAWSPITRGTLFWPPRRPRLLSHKAKPPGGMVSITGSLRPVGTLRRSS